tara:strand:+ start:954 stop:1382 length:429 start_codon:yes stop_codon:yes gene_type:complete
VKEIIRQILKEGPEGTYHREGDVEEWRINPYEMTTNNYKELLDAIDKLPDTIQSINVPIELALFNPNKTTFDPKNESDWRKRVKEIILANTRRGDIVSYSVNSFYGTTSKDYDNHPYYVSFELPGSKEFGERMGSEEYGSLD